MPSERKLLLCIGGPLDGKHVEIYGDYPTRVPVHRKLLSEAPIPSASREMPDMEMAYATYVVDSIVTPDETIEFAIPQCQSAHDTINMLLSAYERSRS